MTALRCLYVAALLLAAIANTCAGIDGRPSEQLTLVLLGVVGLGVGWFMLGGDR